MEFELKDYQADAVQAVLANLTDARDDFKNRERRTAFSLTATTGAGKTVMAAAVIEALFNGNDDYEFPADAGAVVLWFTDDPSLNEQTRFRIREASDRLRSNLIVIGNTFNQEKLDAGKVYFLNSQKLSKNSLLVKGASEDRDDALIDRSASPDLRQFTMWDILGSTIEDPARTLYMILDEAHRGMRRPTSRDRAEKSTIVKRLINGENGAPAVPIVLGISATVDRFNTAMAGSEKHALLPPVVVDPARVQESGLLKDDIRLDFPAERGKFDTVLLRRAARKIEESTELWRSYARSQGLPADESVVPLLVVQVPNTPSVDLLLSAFDTVTDEWPELPSDAMAHVFGDHADIQVGSHFVPYISPELVQDRTNVRVLFAKDAISTGWDCPRAEVLVSFRPAEDETHITQLLGRMVRTPLARRIPGNDRLNSVDCVLPFFNSKTALAVAEVLVGHNNEGEDGTGDTGGGEGRRVLLAAKDMTPNVSIPQSVWELFENLPTQTLPRKASRPIKRLTALAQALSRDGLHPNARRDAYEEMFSVLDGLAARHAKRLAAAKQGLLEVEGESLVAGMDLGMIAHGGSFTETADDHSVDNDFKRAARILSPDIARKYADCIAHNEDDDDGLFDAHVKIAALAMIDGVQDELDREADALARRWFTTYRVAIKRLSDERQEVYAELLAQAPEPQRSYIIRPKVRAEETISPSGAVLPTTALHLMADELGLFPTDLNEWEAKVLERELSQPDIVAWYRNPGRASSDSLVVAYIDGKGVWRRLCPDFIFFSGDPSNPRPSLIDPHGYHLGDALPKLRGFADYADQYGDEFHRIEVVAQMKDRRLRVLDFKQLKVRSAVRDAVDAESLYLSPAATDY